MNGGDTSQFRDEESMKAIMRAQDKFRVCQRSTWEFLSREAVEDLEVILTSSLFSPILYLY